mmetsp:Transcript_31456/g.92252  ORF Transcript_31456/g.92252 Transcript_31456/m.92252 type:complete len:251 (-) Transcript_31456:402-1154(-)
MRALPLPLPPPTSSPSVVSTSMGRRWPECSSTSMRAAIRSIDRSLPPWLLEAVALPATVLLPTTAEAAWTELWDGLGVTMVVAVLAVAILTDVLGILTEDLAILAVVNASASLWLELVVVVGTGETRLGGGGGGAVLASLRRLDLDLDFLMTTLRLAADASLPLPLPYILLGLVLVVVLIGMVLAASFSFSVAPSTPPTFCIRASLPSPPNFCLEVIVLLTYAPVSASAASRGMATPMLPMRPILWSSPP